MDKNYSQEIDSHLLERENLPNAIREIAINKTIEKDDYMGHEPSKYVVSDLDGKTLVSFKEIKPEIPYDILCKMI